MDKKYEKYPEFSNQNTLEQFDQHETLNIPGANTRHLYDFSGHANPDSRNWGTPKRNAGTTYNRNGLWTSLITSNGHISQDFKDIGPGNDYVFTSTEESVDTLFEVPIVDKDMLIVFDQDKDNAWGARQRGDWINTFRAGHLEFTFKTSQQNGVLMSGSTEVAARSLSVFGNIYTPATASGFQINNEQALTHYSSVEIGNNTVQYPPDQNNYYTANFDKGFVNLEIGIGDGKLYLKYYDSYNKKNIALDLLGQQSVADNNWHHVVVNFGRPGIKKYPGTKFNQKFIEFWVDGKIDKRFNNKAIQSEHIVYPMIEVLYGNVRDILIGYIENQDLEDAFIDPTPYLQTGTFDLLKDEPEALAKAMREVKDHIFFRGAMHTFLQSINFPIDENTISYRYNLWKNTRYVKSETLNSYAAIVQPTIQINKKKALKLFWNNLVDSGTNGLTLDDNYQVESYSVTHKVANSPTELFNKNISKPKEINTLENVKVALTDAVIHYAPGGFDFNNHNLARVFQGPPPYGTPSLHPKFPTSVANMDPNSGGRDIGHGSTILGPIIDISYSGTTLQQGDRILLTNQMNEFENGIWIFNGPEEILTRDSQDLVNSLNLGMVYVEDGIYKGKYWLQTNEISSISDWQNWILYENKPGEYVNTKPIYLERWEDEFGNERFIDLQDDLEISKYDLIVFMNYPENEEQIENSFAIDSKNIVKNKYQNFVSSLIDAAAAGSSIFVSSSKLAIDMKIVENVKTLSQETESSDLQSASINPFEPNENAERYFDTHRKNYYRLATTISGLTNRETYILTDFINYIPENEYNNEEWHVKYGYRQFGIQEGDEFIIPSLPLRKVHTQKDLPGQRYSINIENFPMIDRDDVLAGTIVTELSTNYYVGDQPTINPCRRCASTIIIHNGQVLDGKQINGKIFVNLIEDSYTMSIEAYNKAVIQNIPQDVVDETAARRLWQYSTRRINKTPRTNNLGLLTEFGQTVPTNSGGGPLIQAPTNSSIGEIRPDSDNDSKDYQSDLYYKLEDENYQLTEIPVFSMTWLGLKWLES